MTLRERIVWQNISAKYFARFSLFTKRQSVLASFVQLPIQIDLRHDFRSCSSVFVSNSDSVSDKHQGQTRDN